ncbi:small, acid-soluble spore protein, alpha/beta type [Dendrosporobacter sp. 1207_IL3150]|uniref:small, acid-soluble spore protein, alpha/beta type n=1 Tax=Dendrosporobacter sp. 1207_IL3150 TaxID=3084054 RepID=UPI002FDA46AE
MTQKYRSMKELDASLPDKHEVAAELGIPLDEGHNENLTTHEVGKIGGKIGGAKVRKLIEMAEDLMAENAQDRNK